MKWFYDNPSAEIHIRELSRITKISAPHISKLAEENKDIIQIRKVGNLKLLKSKTNKKFRRNKQLNNLKELYESGLIEFLEDFYHQPEYIVLIGSYSTGYNHEKSDIDIVIRTVRKEYPDIDKYEDILGKEIQLITVKSKISEDFKGIINNGILLSGSL